MAQLRTGTVLIPAARLEGRVLVASIAGEIDVQNSPDLRTALLDLLQQYQPSRLVLNLADVTYMDSSAIAVLVETLQRLHRTGGKVYLVALQPRVRGLLEIARLDSIFGIADSEEQAIEAK